MYRSPFRTQPATALGSVASHLALVMAGGPIDKLLTTGAFTLTAKDFHHGTEQTVQP